MSLTYICSVCDRPGNVYRIEDIFFVDPCDNHCAPNAKHTAVEQFKLDIANEKLGIYKEENQ